MYKKEKFGKNKWINKNKYMTKEQTENSKCIQINYLIIIRLRINVYNIGLLWETLKNI